MIRERKKGIILKEIVLPRVTVTTSRSTLKLESTTLILMLNQEADQNQKPKYTRTTTKTGIRRVEKTKEKIALQANLQARGQTSSIRVRSHLHTEVTAGHTDSSLDHTIIDSSHKDHLTTPIDAGVIIVILTKLTVD